MIADELRRLIQQGELKPGERLVQAEIAERFSVSTTPVREAFASLAREGMVRQDAHRGVVVFEPQLDDLRENYEIRGLLEPLATEIAARQMTDDQVAEIKKLVGKMRKARSLVAYHEGNRELHAMIYAAANRPRLAAIIDSLRDSAEAYLRMNFVHEGLDSPFQQHVHAEHEAIAEALGERKPRKAGKLMTEHLANNLANLEKNILTADPAAASSQ